MIRGLAMDGPRAANSGHQGTAMSLAPLAHVLWTRVMRYDAAAPDWADRDRFVLSAGHASILQYAMLHLTGYGLTIEDLAPVPPVGQRDAGSPRGPPHAGRRGHHRTARVRASPTRSAWRSRSSRCEPASAREVCDHRIWGICSDGDLSEGAQPRGGVARRPPRPRPSRAWSTTTTTSPSTARPSWR